MREIHRFHAMLERGLPTSRGAAMPEPDMDADRRALRALGVEATRIPGYEPGNPPHIPWMIRLLRAFPASATSEQIVAFLCVPLNEPADASGAPRTPIDWLQAGGSPDTVCALARRVGET